MLAGAGVAIAAVAAVAYWQDSLRFTDAPAQQRTTATAAAKA